MTNIFSSLMVGGGERNARLEKPNSSKTNSRLKQISAFITLSLIPNVVFAAGGTGLTKVDNFFSTVGGWLAGGGALVLTIALSVAGYKIMWGGQTVREVSPILLGGILIGGGPMIAGILM
ncbi:TrbC/VirB2 family protein [Campylobacter hyointestinalis]|uniref:TrbC/VirB2 family protein n=1 Tax=Campylobacter hyointestinalis TaxID=198 RepID=UPI001599E009|nr:TrbC/VirB2 family protein [Campylobacter hyointestinalis]QKF69271.1 P-type type IV conjugative transfer system relaxase TrbC/VirB2 [Campylobacter hyointestinalis subsp. lawsonii]